MRIINLCIMVLLISCQSLEKSENNRHPKYPFIEDPHNLLEKIDNFIGWTTFEETLSAEQNTLSK